MRCWRCGSEQSPAFFCAGCETVQPIAGAADYFTLLGLPAHPWVDEAALDERYHELSRRLHPDRHAGAEPEEIAASVRATALLNAAYRNLRDLESRGRYWLRRLGGDLGRGGEAVPGELAAFVFEAQDKLAELRDADGDAAAPRAEVEALREDVRGRIERARGALAELLRGWPAPGEGGAEVDALRARLRDLLAAISYLRTLDRDVQRALEE